MALGHASMLEDLNSIRALQEEQLSEECVMEMPRKWRSAPRPVIVNPELRHAVMRCRRSDEEAVSTMSPTSSNR